MQAPTEFMIWRAGPNPTDHGTHIFSERSAALLLDEQARRGNLYSIDVDHLSLSKEAPIEARKAVGWFQLEVRDGDLWAVNVSWTDCVRSGLEASPPEWRYMSPAYDTDENTQEILSLLNIALTNNPATWNVTALASGVKLASLQIRGNGKNMATKSDALKAYLKTMAEDESDEVASKAKAALAALSAMDPPHAEPDGDEPKAETKAAEEDKPKDEPKAETKAAEDDADKKAAEDDDDAKKARKAASRLVADLDADLNAVKKELATLKRERDEKEKKALIASRQMTRELANKLAGKPLELVREIVETLPMKASKDAAAAEKVQPTRGASQGSDQSFGNIDPEFALALDRRMGIAKAGPAIAEQKCVREYRPMSRDDAKRYLASLATEKETVK